MNLDDKILDALRDGGEIYTSGEDLCKLSGISRTAIWKRIEKMREEGYGITASPHLGYRLTAIPDALIPCEIKWKLKTKIIGREIISYKKVDSTNTVAYELAEKGLREGAVIFTESQVKGKGRLGRMWYSPSGCNIYMSCILRPKMTPNEIPKITLIAAVAVAKAIRDFTGLDAMIKWPNDILINGKKVCGILTEMKAEQDRVDFIVLGIGVNVNSKSRDLPAGGSSLLDESRKICMCGDLSRVELAKKLLESLEEHYNILKDKGSPAIIDEWKALSATLGSRVRVVLPGRSFEADAHNIDPDGALVVRLDSGILEKVLSGDVLMVR